MKTIVETTRTTETEVTHDVLGVLMTLFSISAALIGLWSAACIVGTLINHGLAGTLRGYMMAVTGF